MAGQTGSSTGVSATLLPLRLYERIYISEIAPSRLGYHLTTWLIYKFISHDTHDNDQLSTISHSSFPFQITASENPIKPTSAIQHPTISIKTQETNSPFPKRIKKIISVPHPPHSQSSWPPPHGRSSPQPVAPCHRHRTGALQTPGVRQVPARRCARPWSRRAQCARTSRCGSPSLGRCCWSSRSWSRRRRRWWRSSIRTC